MPVWLELMQEYSRYVHQFKISDLIHWKFLVTNLRLECALLAYQSHVVMQVRAKYMTLDAGQNRYVHYLSAIRAIQEHLVQGAARMQIPAVNNTNVDRSVAIIHATVLACLRRQAQVCKPGMCACEWG